MLALINQNVFSCSLKFDIKGNKFLQDFILKNVKNDAYAQPLSSLVRSLSNVSLLHVISKYSIKRPAK